MGTVNWHGLYALVHHHSSEGYVPNGGAKTKGDHPHDRLFCFLALFLKDSLK
jgi:hypothetical protein